MSNINAGSSRIFLGSVVAAVALFAVLGAASRGGQGAALPHKPKPSSPGAIVPSLVPARTSGVAPLAVFFDASGTTDAGVTTRPFHDLEYTWNFGDAGAGKWANGAQPGARSKNSATGPLAAHVFETPGTYKVSVTAYDGTHTATAHTTITVQDPDTAFAGTNTVCVGATKPPVAGAGGCPAHARTVTESSFPAAVNDYAVTDTRVLFKRGDTFTATSSALINRTGPGIVGAFGTGAAPVVQTAGSSFDPFLVLSSSTTPKIKDWRIMDLTLDGLTKPVWGISAGGDMNQVTILRVKVQNVNSGFNFGDSILAWWNAHGHPGHTLWDQLAIVDSSVRHVFGGHGGCASYISAKRFSFMGNVLDDSSEAEHILRLPQVYRGVISNNMLSHPAASKHVIKLHGPTWENGKPPADLLGTDGYSEKIVISDNQLVNGAPDAAVDWTVSIGPQNGLSDERVKDLIVERNLFDGANSNQQVALILSAEEATIRNNICILPASNTCVGSYRRGIEPAPANIRVYNNTMYSSSAGSFTGVTIDSTSTNVRVVNNLGAAPMASHRSMISGKGAAGFKQSGNLLNNSTSALFVNATPEAPADFRLRSGANAARDTGTSVPVFSDFFRTLRPQGSRLDIGAAE